MLHSDTEIETFDVSDEDIYYVFSFDDDWELDDGDEEEEDGVWDYDENEDDDWDAWGLDDDEEDEENGTWDYDENEDDDTDATGEDGGIEGHNMPIDRWADDPDFGGRFDEIYQSFVDMGLIDK